MDIEPVYYKKDNGVLVVERMPVFRTGTFRDSMGYQSTWEGLHLDQMISNFKMLRERGIFENVPVRDGHPNFFGTEGIVVGWHTGLDTEKKTSPADGKEYEYLLSSYEITEPDAQGKIERRTWRNRSAEIGSYVTNDEAEFWPVFRGFAFVDVPAVEGLNFSKYSRKTDGGERTFRIFMEKEIPSVQPENKDDKPVNASFTIAGNQTTDYAAVQAHISKLETANTALSAQVTQLEAFKAEQILAGRASFVKELVTANKVFASQTDALTAFVKELSPEQFEQWKKTYEGTASIPVLGQHGNGNASNAEDDADQKAQASKIADLEARVKMHKQSGMKQSQIEELDSYKQLQLLKKNR
jgi:hypothetical protein